MKTYARQPVKIVKGKGCRLFDDAGNQYLDMVAGIAVCNLGHANPEVAAALKEQADRLFHCSNLYEIPQQELVAAMLSEHAFPAEVFFCNSGAEANEGAIKIVRRYCNTKAARGPRIITADESFHGRTLATLAATGGTDFHGKAMPDIKIGRGFGALNVPDSVLTKLDERRVGKNAECRTQNAETKKNIRRLALASEVVWADRTGKFIFTPPRGCR